MSQRIPVARPLTRLLVDDEELAEETLAEILAPYVGLGSSGELLFRPSFTALGNKTKVLITLLGCSAAHRLRLRASESMTPSEVEKACGIKGNSLRPLLKALAEQRLIAGAAGRYSVPAFAFQHVAELLRHG